MKKYYIKGNQSKSVLEILRENGINIAADCGGLGTCGKCKIFINGKETLACKTFTKEDIEVEIPEESCLDNLCVEVIDNYIDDKEYDVLDDIESTSYSMAVDIGTTTVAAALIDKKNKVINTLGIANSQKSFGSDVISRVEASSENLELLKISIRKDVNNLRRSLAEMSQIEECEIEKVVISANTVMEHLFMGFSCEGFEKAPYRAVTLEEIKDNEFQLMPCISPFVGADILGGIGVCEMDKREEITALIDFGTNGEMALGNRDKILVASTAAGPVFEGGNISCGMSAMNGAIDKVDISGFQVFVRTIGEKVPMGICASGLIEAICSMKKNRIIDKNGILDEEWQEDGFYLVDEIYINQKDINNFLMAKSAIAAGLKVLCRKMNIEIGDIEKLYIAGGLGAHINIAAACEIGLIPEELIDKCQQIGNSSLKGAVLRCQGRLMRDRCDKIKAICSEIILADEELFQSTYIEGMMP